MAVNLNHFFYFHEVARHGSFTRAARELLVSQSALSVQIKALETSLGVVLFDRRRGGVTLTDAGERAYAAAQRIFTEVDTLVSELSETDRRVAAAVNVGTVNSIGIYILPDLLGALRSRQPGLRVRFDFRESERVLDQLYQGKTDLAIVPWQRAYPDLASTPLTRHKMFLVAPPGHALASADHISPRELESHPFVGYHEGMHTRAMIDALFKRMGLEVEYAIESSNAATIKEMVIAGMGLAFLPEIAVADELRRGALVRLEVAPLVMNQDVTLYTRKNRTLSRSATTFVDFVREYFAPRKHHGERARPTEGV